jgi:CHASE1-domain containing sensor protein
MIFLIEYDRAEGRLVTIERFTDSDRKKAEDARLNLELELNLKGIQSEVVLLEASTEEDVRRTHRRYFETLAELIAIPANWKLTIG